MTCFPCLKKGPGPWLQATNCFSNPKQCLTNLVKHVWVNCLNDFHGNNLRSEVPDEGEELVRISPSTESTLNRRRSASLRRSLRASFDSELDANSAPNGRASGQQMDQWAPSQRADIQCTANESDDAQRFSRSSARNAAARSLGSEGPVDQSDDLHMKETIDFDEADRCSQRSPARDSMSGASRSSMSVHRDDLCRSATMDNDAVDRCSQFLPTGRTSARDSRSKSCEGEAPVDSDHSSCLRRRTSEGTKSPAPDSVSRASGSHVLVHQNELRSTDMINFEEVDRCSEPSPARDSPSKSCEDEVFHDRDHHSYLRNSRTSEELDRHRERSSGTRATARVSISRASRSSMSVNRDDLCRSATIDNDAVDRCSQFSPTGRNSARDSRSKICEGEAPVDSDHSSCWRRRTSEELDQNRERSSGIKSPARESMSRASRSTMSVHPNDLCRSATMDNDGFSPTGRNSARDTRSKICEGEASVDSDHSSCLRRRTSEELDHNRERSSGIKSPARESMSRASRSHVRVHQTDLVRCEMINSEKVDRCSERSPARDSPSKSCEDEVFHDRDHHSYKRNSRTYEELDCHRERSSGSRSPARDSISRASRSSMSVQRDDLFRSEIINAAKVDRCSERSPARDSRSKSCVDEVFLDRDHPSCLRKSRTSEELDSHCERSSDTRSPARDSISRASRSSMSVQRDDLCRSEILNAEKVDRCSEPSPARDSPSKSCEGEVFLDRDHPSCLRKSRTSEELDSHRERSCGTRHSDSERRSNLQNHSRVEENSILQDSAPASGFTRQSCGVGGFPSSSGAADCDNKRSDGEFSVFGADGVYYAGPCCACRSWSLYGWLFGFGMVSLLGWCSVWNGQTCAGHEGLELGGFYVMFIPFVSYHVISCFVVC